MFLHCLTLIVILRELGASPTEDSLKPDHVTFSNRNLKSILQWQPASESNYTVLYNVEYKIYGHQWMSKEECQGISRTTCDLTTETMHLQSMYYGRVQAIHYHISSAWVETKQFIPFKEMAIDPPQLTLTGEKYILQINITPPFQSKRLTFTIDVKLNGTLVHQIITENNTIQITDLDPEKEYCISGTMRYTLNTYKWRKSKASDSYCITLKAPDAEPHPMTLVSHITLGLFAILFMAFGWVLLILCYKLIYRPKVTLPPSLVIEERQMLMNKSKTDSKEIPEISDSYQDGSKLQTNEYVFCPVTQQFRTPLQQKVWSTDDLDTCDFGYPLHQEICSQGYILQFVYTTQLSDTHPELFYLHGTTQEYGNVVTAESLPEYENLKDKEKNQCYTNVQNKACLEHEYMNNNQQRENDKSDLQYKNIVHFLHNTEYQNVISE
uniref:Interleukin-20 receptor subunit alpha-like n=1 Tax=Lepisosteus oculatus TaxID=7918 RepID=W5NL56_LEPOC|nr:PREDICTED: interleukin-20 receptor subunit alpha-like isoform X1 [Lepisosteus oculatus]